MKLVSTIALAALAALPAACKSDKGGTGDDGFQKPIPKDAAAKPKRLGRGHPPQVVTRARTNGRILASNAETLFWVERSGKGNFVVGGKKSGGDSFMVAGPLTSVTDLVATADTVVIAASALSAQGNKDQKRGVLAAPASGGGEPVVLAPDPGQLAVAGDRVFILYRGTIDKPGKVIEVGIDGKSEPKLVYQAKTGLGRAAVVAHAGKPYWLLDARVDKGGVKSRVGFIHTVGKSPTEHVEVIPEFPSPGLSIVAHGKHFYFTAKPDGSKRTLFRAPIAGGKAEPFLDRAWEIQRFAIDDSGIYAYATLKGWKLVRFDHQKLEPRVLSTPELKLSSRTLVLDDAHLTWGTSGSLRRTSKTPPAKPVKKERPYK